MKAESAEPVRRRRSRRRNDRFHQRKEEILRSAIELINRFGVKGMTIAAIAEKLGVVPTAVSYYYPKKEAIAAECLLRATDALDKLVTVALQANTPGERLRSFLNETMAMHAAIALGKQPAIVPFADVRAVGDPQVDQAYSNLFRHMREILGAPPLDRVGRSMQNARAQVLMSEANWSEVWLAKYGPEHYPRVAERMCDILANGVARATAVRLELPAVTPHDEELQQADISLEALMNAATVLINTQGYKGASVENISAYLKVTKGSFYHHIDAKFDLLTACFERTLGAVRSAQQQAEAAGRNGFGVLHHLVMHLVRDQMTGAVPLLRASALKSVPASSRSALVESIDRIVFHIAGVISDGIADGSIRTVDPVVGAYVTFELINGAADLPAFTPGLTTEQRLEFYRETLTSGLLRIQEPV